MAFYSFLLDLVALAAVDLDSYLEVVAPSFAGLEALIQEVRPMKTQKIIQNVSMTLSK